MSGQRLDAARIIDTVATLKKRIHERFPDAGLYHVCDQLLTIAKAAQQRSIKIARPNYWARLIPVLVVIVVIGATAATVMAIKTKDEALSIAEWIQVSEAGANDIIIIGAVVFFAMTLESKWKRKKILAAIHELRSLAHIIDMHQLTKDPERLMSTSAKLDTASSPKRTMDRFQLSRYLDYCSEMLSLIGKIGVLYVQDYPDTEAVGAVNDIETLTTGLARKIWQKIMILHEGTEKG